ncbi:MAG: type II and III secretion system protein family protein [Proteobacteria bacterium]|nr:type II and III secretion system protein family protein [Pseudomonadota bacterium]
MQGLACRRTIATALLLTITSFLVASETAQAQQGATIVRQGGVDLEIDIHRGILLRLDRDAENIFIVNPAIADVDVKSPRLIYVFGRAVGETTIYAIDENEEVIYSAGVVIRQNFDEVLDALARLLPDATLTVEMIRGNIILSGYVRSPEEVEIAERLLGKAIGQNQELINRVKITMPTQINLRVKFAEVTLGVLKQLGFRQTASLSTGNLGLDFISGGGGFSTSESGFGILGAFSGDRFNLGIALDALETEGYLSTLAEPNLTTLSGETASFLAGGEFPVPTTDRNGQRIIQFRKFGVQLDFTPVILSENLINLRVTPEVSQLTNLGAVVIDGITVFGLTTRSANTTVELASGQSFAIAGLLQSSLVQDKSKFPLLGDLPILGALFRSDQFRREETELVIVVTPYIVRPFDARQMVLPTDGLQNPSDVSRYLKDGHLTNQARPGARLQKSGPGVGLRGSAGFRLKR